MNKQEVIEMILLYHQFTPTKIDRFKTDNGFGWKIKAIWKDDIKHEGVDITANSFNETMYDLLELLNATANELEVEFINNDVKF